MTCRVRKGWDSYFMDIAREVATRATCDRKHVGAVFVRDRTLLATGYNGSVRGLPHCDDVGHDMVDTHCVPGDVVVSKFQTGYYNTGHRTIREIWQQWQHNQKRGAMRRMKIRSINEAGVVVPDHIVDIWRLNKKPLVRVTTRLGRSVRTTEDHRFKTPSGWLPIGGMREGDHVGLNGRPLYDDPAWLRARYEDDGMDQLAIARLVGCSRRTVKARLDAFGIERRPFRFGGWNRGFRRDESHSYKGRDVNPSVARSRARRYALAERCAVCSSTGSLDVHHIDGDHLNDAIENLATLCVPCHNLAHTPHARREAVVYDEIVRIEDAGVEEVFDIQTQTHHNFVGDGFVLHNCVRTVHAEMNAVAQAAKHGVRLDGAELYVTASTCWPCFKLVVNVGVRRIVFDEEYRLDPRIGDAVAALRSRGHNHAIGLWRVTPNGALVGV